MNKKEQIDLLYKLKKEVEKSNHTVLVEQINEVIRKVYEDKKVASFIGHFSSGKSSLINYLLEEDILPSSPVPTTSNSAQITISEQEEIIVNLENQEYAYARNYAEVKKINTENQRIESVEIKHIHSKLPLGLTLQDTPGIDATFSNHEANTMKYLLTSDVIVYTVEYNHVESEKNFKEMKRLNSLGMPLVFVVNQIDKHNEEEVKFNDFKAAILQNLATWDIQIEKIFFTSIYEHELNEVAQLKDLLFNSDLIENSRRQFFDRITSYITGEQLRYLEDEKAGILDTLGFDQSELEANRNSIQESQALSEEQQLFKTSESAETYFLSSIRTILKNAYIVPFEIREEIKRLLEVYSPDFKVGGLFGKEKKRQELRAQQMTEVLEALNASIEKQINFHIRALYDQHAKYSVVEDVRHFTYNVTADELEGLMNSQALITNDYVLNYTDQLKKFIEQSVVKENRPHIKMFIENINMSKMQPAVSHQAEALNKYDQLTKLIESLTTRNYQHYYIHVDESIDKLVDRKQVKLELQDSILNKPTDKLKKSVQKTDLDTALTKFEKFKEIAYFSHITKRLEAQLDRIQHDVTRIVVFGAFSAGKSSLINAMLGQKVLISSPNPTTAAITELTYGQTHSVKFKTNQMLLDELNKIGRSAGIEATDINLWLKDYHKQQPALDHQFKKYIQALEANYEHYLPYLDGQIVTIQDDEIEKFTAVDAHSAFVDRIYLQYEIDFLKDKVIIDSPGIGSTNMRHTNETTEIIADSDLLIYVSYFNHVFTENDKQFIQYLNELQILSTDSATFYVINAIDLARNNTEIEQVKNYFSSELEQLNAIPRIYELSSKQAMSARDDNFNHYMAELQQFAQVDSRLQKIRQFENGVQQLEEEARTILADASQAREREAAHRAYYDEVKRNPVFTDEQLKHSIEKAEQELNEQLTFMTDRFRIQLSDLIKVYFNRGQVDAAGYMGALTDKLEEELSMIIPRLNHAAFTSLASQTAVIRQTLSEHHLPVAIPDFKFLPVRQNIDAVMQPISIKTSNRSFNTKEAVDKLYETIHQSSMALVSEKLIQFRRIIENELREIQPVLLQKWTQLNEEIEADIMEQEQHVLDETVVKEIKKVMEG
ncbi:dynamin family protein [Macrococcus brunensis]|uniref:dynamin family protein n=1 Tax=Macrococcus brunensis TaxID=198483 RepID=UPI001EEF980E|nr:dynamin family protein [Macrococcus brunensis]ULG73330.1 dynamin family protein [Macrococcus brunensis]